MSVRDLAVLECREVVEIVSDLLDGALAAGDRARVEQHLLVCPPCSAYVAQVKATVVQLADLGASKEPAQVPGELVERFRQWKRRGPNDEGA